MTARLPDSAVVRAHPRTDTPMLVAGTVMHRRLRPVVNEFAYPSFCLRLPLSRLTALDARGIHVNRRGIVSFHERDHGPRDGTPLEPWIRALLTRERVDADGEIVLHAFPRMLGYVFNPVSFWVCHDAGGAVRAVLAEVNNTFGETHHYLLAHADGRALVSGETLTARKCFHVSPFCAVRGRYAFRFHFAADRWLARIDYFDEHDDERVLLETRISGTIEPVPERAGTLLWRYRWHTLGVIARIHWQAARLWLRRVPLFTKPAPPPHTLTRNS